jgi:hypothetical protein
LSAGCSLFLLCTREGICARGFFELAAKLGRDVTDIERCWVTSSGTSLMCGNARRDRRALAVVDGAYNEGGM